MDDGMVTVVVPAYNEAASIEQCLGSVLTQSYADLQVIIVDGGSTDGTPDMVRRVAEFDDRVELLTNTERLIPISLNKAVADARGRWLIRVDAHSTIPSDYVQRAVDHLSAGHWGGVGGRKDGQGETAAGAAIAVALGSKFGVGNSVYHHGDRAQVVDHIPFGCYPTELIRELGGWDESLAVNQDFEFDQRVRKAGHQLLFDPEMRILWHSRQTHRELFAQYMRYGKGKTAVFGIHPDSIKPRQVAPAGLVAALALAAVVAPKSPRVSALLASPYAAFIGLGTALEHSKLDEPVEKLHLPAAFASMHIGFGLGLWKGAAQHVRGGLSHVLRQRTD